MSYETWPLVHLGFFFLRRVSCQFHFFRETIANQTPKSMEIWGGGVFLRFEGGDVLWFQLELLHNTRKTSTNCEVGKLDVSRCSIQDVRDWGNQASNESFFFWDSKSTIISSVFPGKDRCFIEDFQITNPGDSYFYSWLDLQGLQSGTLHFISPSFWSVGSDATAPRIELWLVSIYIEGIRGYLPPRNKALLRDY